MLSEQRQEHTIMLVDMKICILPEYLYRGETGSVEYTVKLTTEPEIRLMDPSFYYLPSVLSQEEADRLNEVMKS